MTFSSFKPVIFLSTGLFLSITACNNPYDVKTILNVRAPNYFAKVQEYKPKTGSEDPHAKEDHFDLETSPHTFTVNSGHFDDVASILLNAGKESVRLKADTIKPMYFNIQYQGPQSDKTYKDLLHKMLEYYGLELHKKSKKGEVLALKPDSTNSLASHESDATETDSTTMEQKQDKVSIKKVSLSRLASELSRYYRKKIIYSEKDSTTYDLKINLDNNLSITRDSLQKNYGISFKKVPHTITEYTVVEQ